MAARADVPRAVRIGPRQQFRGLIFCEDLPVVPREAPERHFPQIHGKYRAVATLRGFKMAAIMSLDEPRPRGTLLGERADRRRVREVEHFFRCKACNGWIDARDYVWVEDHEGPLPHPAQDQAQ
jgi:hypothetical protein